MTKKYVLIRTESTKDCEGCDLKEYCKDPFNNPNIEDTGQSDDELEGLVTTCLNLYNSNIKLMDIY